MCDSENNGHDALTTREFEGGTAVAEDGELWREAAACRDTDTELFFPISSRGHSREQSERAKDFCTRCPVVRCCLEFALSTRQMYGVWGGMTEEERIHKLIQDQRESRLAAGSRTLTVQ